MDPATLTLASSAVKGISGVTGKPSPPAISSLSDRSPINIAPVGINLGSILQPTMEGSAVNGGSGVTLPSRWIPTDARYDFASETFRVADNGDGSLMFPFLLAGAGGILAFVLFRRK